MLEKNGMLTEDSMCDFDHTKKAAYIDEASQAVASEEHKDKLVKPVKLTDEKGN